MSRKDKFFPSAGKFNLGGCPLLSADACSDQGENPISETNKRVLASNHFDYVEGDIVLAPPGWRTHALSDGTGLYDRTLRKLDLAAAPVTTGLAHTPAQAEQASAGLVSARQEPER